MNWNYVKKRGPQSIKGSNLNTKAGESSPDSLYPRETSGSRSFMGGMRGGVGEEDDDVLIWPDRDTHRCPETSFTPAGSFAK